MKTKEQNITIIVLSMILILGAYLRIYHVDYPPIGYHSMKEIHYLSIARGYLDHGDFLHRRALYLGMNKREGYLEEYPQFPFLPLIYYVLWKLFGVNIAIARIVVILFSLGTIVIGYLCTKELRCGEREALLTGFFMSILPIGVFFGRNIQPDTPALFFLLLGIYFYLRWIRGLQLRHFIYMLISLFLTAIIKGAILFFVIPIFFIFPYGKLTDNEFRTKIIRQTRFFAIFALLIIIWLLFSKLNLVYGKRLFPADRIFEKGILGISFWKAKFPLIKQYSFLNFTKGILSVSLIGFIISYINHKSQVFRYLMGTIISVLLYYFMLSSYVIIHSYYQLPLVFAVSLGSSVFLGYIADLVEKFIVKNRYISLIPVTAFMIYSFQIVRPNINWQHDIQIIGVDVAGEYIRDHSSGDERIFIAYGSLGSIAASYQSQFFGILWTANQRGAFLPTSIKEIKFGEDERNMKWILLYKFKNDARGKKVFDYIRSNYEMKQIAYANNEVLYYLLRKGGEFDLSKFDTIDKKFAREYEFSKGTIRVYTKDE